MTDRNRSPIYTVKKQNGVNRLFVTFRSSGLW